MSHTSTEKVLQTFSPTKVILPTLIGLAIVVWMMAKNVNADTLRSISWTWHATAFVVLAAIAMVLRHLALMYRLIVLTRRQLGWKQAFQVITLWEFGSSVTPSVVGGTAGAFILLSKEGLNMGKIVAVVMAVMFLDGVFFLLSIPLLWLVCGKVLFAPSLGLSPPDWASAMPWILTFVLAYGIVIGNAALVGYGLFFKPRSVKKLMVGLTKLPALRRFRQAAIATGNDLMVASENLKTENRRFWVAGFAATAGSWIFRFLVLNLIILALAGVSNHLLLFGRQIIIYIFMILAPTPGGSGIAEGIFKPFLYDFFPDAADIAGAAGILTISVLVWRLISYYPYLILGIIVLPNWVRRVFGKPKG